MVADATMRLGVQSMPIIYNLEPQFDSRASFYGKARVEVDGDVHTLYSYGTAVARIANGKFEKLDMADYSQTTRRHVREFAKQHGFNA